jgi:hypothetical protein
VIAHVLNGSQDAILSLPSSIVWSPLVGFEAAEESTEGRRDTEEAIVGVAVVNVGIHLLKGPYHETGVGDVEGGGRRRHPEGVQVIVDLLALHVCPTDRPGSLLFRSIDVGRIRGNKQSGSFSHLVSAAVELAPSSTFNAIDENGF